MPRAVLFLIYELLVSSFSIYELLFHFLMLICLFFGIFDPQYFRFLPVPHVCVVVPVLVEARPGVRGT